MFDPRVESFANLLTHYCIQTQKNDRVFIETTSTAEPLVLALVKEVLEAGGHPHILMEPDRYQEVYFKYAADHQLEFTPTFRYQGYSNFESRIWIQAMTNTRELNRIEPHARTLATRALEPLFESQFNRETLGTFKRVTTLFPTTGYAQDAKMSLVEFEDLFYRACHIGNPGEAPADLWMKQKISNEHILEIVDGHHQVRLSGPDCDLEFSVSGRNFISSYGRRNMPDGEVFTGPVESSANGKITFSFPSLLSGVEVSGVELVFQDGKVTDCSAQIGEATLISRLELDPGARYLGEFGIGTNYGITKPTGRTLLDEKVGGSIHLALGRGYPVTGNMNESALHWDLITDFTIDSQIELDGEVVYRDGKFIV